MYDIPLAMCPGTVNVNYLGLVGKWALGKWFVNIKWAAKQGAVQWKKGQDLHCRHKMVTRLDNTWLVIMKAATARAVYKTMRTHTGLHLYDYRSRLSRLHSTTLISSYFPFIYNPVIMGARLSRSSHTGTVHKVVKVTTLRMDIHLAVPTRQDLLGVGTSAGAISPALSCLCNNALVLVILSIKHWAPFANTTLKTLIQLGWIITSIIKCGMKLLIHSQTSTVQPLKFRNG